MCTVTFIARKRGYLLGMNRDEKLTRSKALPPKKYLKNGRTVVGPSEPKGGTWISLNDGGATFALINWYSIRTMVAGTVSRGSVILATAAETSAQCAFTVLSQLPLSQIAPFRLIGIFPAEKQVCEWRWDLSTLICWKHGWETRQWISSGHDEIAAQRIRTRTFRAAMNQRTAGTAAWLRQLHRSHVSGPGPFSICMHRAEAATVSYTEILATNQQATMNYYESAPCGAVSATRQVPSSINFISGSCKPRTKEIVSCSTPLIENY